MPKRYFCWVCGKTPEQAQFYGQRPQLCVSCLRAKAGAERTRRGRELARTVPLTPAIIRELLHYHADTGRLSAKLPWAMHVPGDLLGALRPDGRRQIRIGPKMYLEHRVIWLWVYGEWPSDQIDHKDMNRGNNRIENLRVCSNGLNSANRRVRPDSLSGIKGVRFEKRRNGWVATITKNWKQIHLGQFATPKEAADAYREAAERLHGDFARTG